MTGLRIRARRLAAAAVVAFASLICVGGCAAVPKEPTNPDRVGSVVDAGKGVEHGGWRAWAYRTRTGDVCIEVDGTAGAGYRCGPGETLQTPGIIVIQGGTFVVGGTRAAGAAHARLDDADGSHVTASLVAADPIAPGLRVYILAAPESPHPQSVVVLDAAGGSIASAPVGG